MHILASPSAATVPQPRWSTREKDSPEDAGGNGGDLAGATGHTAGKADAGAQPQGSPEDTVRTHYFEEDEIVIIKGLTQQSEYNGRKAKVLGAEARAEVTPGRVPVEVMPTIFGKAVRLAVLPHRLARAQDVDVQMVPTRGVTTGASSAASEVKWRAPRPHFQKKRKYWYWK